MESSPLNDNVQMSLKKTNIGKNKIADPTELVLSYKRNKNNPTLNKTNALYVPKVRPKSRTRIKYKTITEPVTPSMSSVISQIRHLSRSEDDIDEISHQRKNSTNEIDSVHPLDIEVKHESITKAIIPSVKILNLQDLELQDSLDNSDIKLLIPPLYERPKSGNNDITKLHEIQNIIPDENKDLELEVWPNSLNDSNPVSSDLSPNNKRIRQRSMNPNFLKMLAIERTSIQKNILPEVRIDNQTFNNLSTHPNTDIVNTLDFNDDIKLAIKTKLKIWNKLSHGDLRSDMYGDSSPHNMIFVQLPDSNGTMVELLNSQQLNNTNSSLVRANSTVKPWVQDSDKNLDNQMLKPYGQLRNGSQYVVKGWCDNRFVQ